jgi:TRAP-type C4-dicarboxylate transport system permease small subunit
MTLPTDRDRGEATALADDDVIDLSDVHWTDTLVVFVFWVLAFVVFLQFFTRYVLNDSLGWTEEIARFLLIAVTFIGSVIAVRRQSHIAVEIIYRWTTRPMRRVMQFLVDALATVFYGALTWFTIELSQRTRQMMVSIDVPKAAVYWGVAACFAAMTILSLIVTWRHLRTGTSRLIDPDRGLESPQSID